MEEASFHISGWCLAPIFLSWNACVPHYVKNIGDGKAVVLIAAYSDTELKDIFG
jgi:hypothetical protein